MNESVNTEYGEGEINNNNLLTTNKTDFWFFGMALKTNKKHNFFFRNYLSFWSYDNFYLQHNLFVTFLQIFKSFEYWQVVT